jgi:pyrrolidone-carboxylate peptidase
VSHNAARASGALSRAGIAVGTFICAVSFALFIHSVSQLSSPLVSAAFIAIGVVLRQRASSSTGLAIANGALAGGVVAAIAAIALAAADIGG